MKVPLLTGTRLLVADAPDDAVVLRPRAPEEGIADVGVAVRDALRFPLAGPPLAGLATRGGRATIVVEPAALPIPGVERDPRQTAIAAAVDELERLGVPVERQTLLVSSGLTRRPSGRLLEALVSPEFARRFRGRVEVHDAEDPELVDLGRAGNTRLRANRALVETDLVVTVTAAETVLHGGPAALLGATGAETLRAAGAYSLLETGASLGWRLGLELERALAARVGVCGVSLTLTHPRFSGASQGYPYDPEALARVVRSPLRRVFGVLPNVARERVLRAIPAQLSVSSVLAGPPSVAHAEALLRGIQSRATVLDGRLDAVCVAIPRVTPHLPRERPNPLLAASLGLGLALRYWRDAFPLVEGGTAILVHPFTRAFAHPTQHPYRRFFGAARFGRELEELAEAEREAAADERALAAYRRGETCHPLLPFADWAGCAPALSRLGSVLVAGCRDAVAARQLGFVPVQSVGAALEMARGLAGRELRVGFLLAPPYFPLVVRDGE